MHLPAAVGAWSRSVEAVNSLVSDLVRPTLAVARVIESVANGDLSQRMPLEIDGIPLRGEFLRIGAVVNTMVGQLNGFASEVSRVAREVGTDGKLGGQARVPGVAGTWKDLTDNVNAMAANLTGQVRNIAEVTTAVANGDLSKKITVDVRGEILELKSTINTMVDQLNGFASEVSRVAREVGTDGKLGGQARVPGVAGTWKDLTDNVNAMAANLTGQVRNIAEVTTAVAKGDLSKKITVDVRGEILELKSTINTMVDQLNGFASEVSRVAREVGTEGKLGGQSHVPGAAGTWKDLTDNVNAMAANLTGQVRNIADVTTAVAKGDLSKKITVDVRGEILELKSTINTLVDQLNGFASEVSRVAREVGTEGMLGGQARVPGVAGIWEDLTDNVNQLAANLTTQVRAIAEVATAVTKGDLTRSIMVEAKGEVAALKDNINEMIRNLKDTTLKNDAQDWLKTNLAKFSRMLQGQGDLVTVSQLVLSELVPLVNAQQGVIYTQSRHAGAPRLEMLASYGSRVNADLASVVQIGEGLIGQCAFERKRIVLEGMKVEHIRISSGLVSVAPSQVVILPVLFEGEVKAVLELATVKHFDATHMSFLEQLAESIGIVFNTVEANMRTAGLLEQSQSLTRELQKQQGELKQTNDQLERQAENLQRSESELKMQRAELRKANDELQRKAELLSEQMKQVEYKNEEIELAKAALEEKAEQLALSSRYKSEFLANMSHELRTPLNSLLILAKLLADNPGDNLTAKQIDYAQTIYAAGADLLSLISDILDLAKIESGTITLDIGTLRLVDLRDYVERTFRATAQQKKLDFRIRVDPKLPPAIETDEKRLQQVLKNLLSNAFKFTERGYVELAMSAALSGWTHNKPSLDTAELVIAFAVTDTGVGIPGPKQQIIFEAFRQADGTTSRHYGGTGLGLSISRELTGLLGGEIAVQSEPGSGSTFVFYLPIRRAQGVAEALATDPKQASPTPAAVKAGKALPRARQADETELAVPIGGDAGRITETERVIVLVDGDAESSAASVDVARKRGFKVVASASGRAAIAEAKACWPAAIAVVLRAPDTDVWAALDRFAENAQTRRIPTSAVAIHAQSRVAVQILSSHVVPASAAQSSLAKALREAGGLSASALRRVLVADGDEARCNAIESALQAHGTATARAATVADVAGVIRDGRCDALVIGPSLADGAMSGVLNELAAAPPAVVLPIVSYGLARRNGADDGDLLLRVGLLYCEGALPADGAVPEMSRFLERVSRGGPGNGRPASAPRVLDQRLENRKALIVDDDVRNVFALSAALEQLGMVVLNAEDGKEGIEVLKRVPDVDVVLMDVMMPELDGYDTIRIIRGHEQFRSLPIIAVTAKAMKGDRDKCLDAGASDYVAKPVNVEHLASRLVDLLAR
jgi:signal transduction histidine kinase/HAMP domain-containing protein/CheY-like chemotaxis protein